MRYSGIDLHSNNALVAVIDDQGRVVYCKRVTNDLELIVATLAPNRTELQGVVVEPTFNWQPASPSIWPIPQRSSSTRA